MSQRKTSVAVKDSRSRKTSEASTNRTSLTKHTTSTHGRMSSVTFPDSDGVPHHHVGHLLTLPAEMSRRRRSYSWQGHPIPTKVAFEPTYRLEPTEQIDMAQIKSMAQEETDKLLHDSSYSISEAPNLAQILTERLKTETKGILPAGNRYKVVVYVVITPKARQGIQISSRCLWETQHDTEINGVYENNDLQAVISIYCVYAP